jgi:hypothetical protein
MFLLFATAWLFSAIRILGNGLFGPILVFWTFFGSLLGHILNEFENNLGRVLMFWACLIFLSPESFENILISLYFFIFAQVLHEKSNTFNQTNVNIRVCKCSY